MAVAEQTDCNGGLAPCDTLQRVCFHTNSYDPRNPRSEPHRGLANHRFLPEPTKNSLIKQAKEKRYSPSGSLWQGSTPCVCTSPTTASSGVSNTSDVTFTALPDSRMHVQLVWDTPTDLDLHMVYAGQSEGEVYHRNYDCYWQSCRPGCEDFTAGACDQPTRWFIDHEAFEGPNPGSTLTTQMASGQKTSTLTSQ